MRQNFQWTGPVGLRTLLLFTLFVVSVSALWALSPRPVTDHFFYSINEQTQGISSCENDVGKLADVLEKTKNMKDSFSGLQWKDSALFNPSEGTIDACAVISRKSGETQFRCLKFNPRSFASEEKFVAVFSSEKECWDDRDLTYISKIESLYEEGSLAYIVHQIGNFFQGVGSPKQS